MKTFSAAGPVRPNRHYNIPALSRWNMEEIYRLIRDVRDYRIHGGAGGNELWENNPFEV